MSHSEQREKPTHIVAVGASAGGLEAIGSLFEAMPGDTGMAFVVIQHLSPDFNSLMDEIMVRYTGMAIHKAEEGMSVERDSIYLIPANKQMVIKGDRLHLTERSKSNAPEALITQFFESLAEEWGEKTVGVVLSGTGSDGSRGLAAIRAVGGLTLVQQPATAKFDGMPKAAIATGCADMVLATSDFAEVIVKFGESPVEARKMLGRLPPDAEVDDLKRVYQLLNEHGGIAFDQYKPSTVLRRIDRRVKMVGVDNLAEYRQILEQDDNEVDLLFQDLLIGVTEFFRDTEAFEALENGGLRSVFGLVDPGKELRIWVAGSATGEEVYSIAILLDEYCLKNESPTRWKIFATDVHRHSLSVANLGEYSEASLKNVSEDRLERYFSPSGSGYRVSRALRDQIVFANHNLLEDAPFARVHMVSCRNLLIYFKPDAQKKALHYFRFALVSGGVLFLGNSETPGDIGKDMEKIADDAVIFRKISDSPHAMANVSYPQVGIKMVEKSNRAEDRFPERLFNLVLTNVLPGGILINNLGEIVYCAGAIRDFMRPPSGRMINLALDMLPEGLQMHLTGGIQQAKRQKKEIRYNSVPVSVKDEELLLTLAITPIHDNLSGLDYTFVSIEQKEEQSVSIEGTFDASKIDELTLQRIKELENDLRLSQEGLQNVVEELETSNEELQSTNEELIASNEELQSTNEELQSVNEELYTVNSEYDAKNRQLAEVNADLDNLLKSTQIGVIFLDGDLQIRRFTPAAASAFNLMQSDIGRPLDHLSTNLDPVDLELVSRARHVARGGKTFESEVRNGEGEHFLLRLLPFLDNNNSPNGVVVTLFSIDVLKEMESQKDEAMAQFKMMVDSSKSITWCRLDTKGNFTNHQTQWEQFTDQKWPEYEDLGWIRAFHPDDREGIRRTCKKAFNIWQDFELVNIRIFNRETEEYRYCRMALCPQIEEKTHVAWLGYVFEQHDAHLAMQTLEEQKALLGGVIENAPLGVAVKDLTGRYVLVNETMAEILCEPDPDELIGKTISNFLPSRLALPVKDNDEVILKTGEKRVFNEVMGVGEFTRVFEVTRFPLLGADGKPSGLVCLASDLTDREREIKLRAQTEELSRVNRELARKNQELDDFAHVISHDLKQPLRTMTAFGEVLSEELGDSLGEEEADALLRIRRAGEQMREMIDAILEYSRSARADVSLTDISVGEILSLVQESLDTEIQESEVVFHISENLPTVLADKMLLYRIMLNLIANAIKFNESGKPEVWVSARRQDEYTFISIEDNGIGVPLEYSKTIFKPFERLHTKGDYTGHGIGLAISDRLVQAQGGEIWCEERSAGDGSRFVFTIPNQ